MDKRKSIQVDEITWELLKRRAVTTRQSVKWLVTLAVSEMEARFNQKPPKTDAERAEEQRAALKMNWRIGQGLKALEASSTARLEGPSGSFIERVENHTARDMALNPAIQNGVDVPFHELSVEPDAYSQAPPRKRK